MAPTVVILAAGRGTRMRSATPKLAHDLCGRPLLAWPLEAARAGRVVIVACDLPFLRLDLLERLAEMAAGRDAAWVRGQIGRAHV